MNIMFLNIENSMILHHYFDAISFMERNKDVQLSEDGIKNFEALSRELQERKILTFH